MGGSASCIRVSLPKMLMTPPLPSEKSPPIGMTAKTRKAGTAVRYGARMKIRRSAWSGSESSFMKNFRPSATRLEQAEGAGPVGADAVLEVADGLALEPDHEQHRHQQQGEGDDRLEQDDEDDAEVDVAGQQRVEGQDLRVHHSVSTRTSVTGCSTSIRSATPLRRRWAMAALPSGTPASATTGTVTVARGDETAHPAAGLDAEPVEDRRVDPERGVGQLAGQHRHRLGEGAVVVQGARHHQPQGVGVDRGHRRRIGGGEGDARLGGGLGLGDHLVGGVVGTGGVAVGIVGVGGLLARGLGDLGLVALDLDVGRLTGVGLDGLAVEGGAVDTDLGGGDRRRERGDHPVAGRGQDLGGDAGVRWRHGLDLGPDVVDRLQPEVGAQAAGQLGGDHPVRAGGARRGDRLAQHADATLDVGVRAVDLARARRRGTPRRPSPDDSVRNRSMAMTVRAPAMARVASSRSGKSASGSAPSRTRMSMRPSAAAVRMPVVSRPRSAGTAGPDDADPVGPGRRGWCARAAGPGPGPCRGRRGRWPDAAAAAPSPRGGPRRARRRRRRCSRRPRPPSPGRGRR